LSLWASAWSPDGTKIAFNSGRPGVIDVMNSDGSGQTNLTNNPDSGDSEPAWSPDGSRILFVSARDGNSEIYVMNADGSGQTNLTNNPDSGDSEPAWSPDGSRILFVSWRGGNAEIYVMNADGSGIVDELGQFAVYASDGAGKRSPTRLNEGTFWNVHSLHL